MLSYKNQREKAITTAKRREDDARRIEEVQQRQIAYERKQARVKEKQRADRDRREADVRRRSTEHKRRRDANVQSRQPSLRDQERSSWRNQLCCKYMVYAYIWQYQQLGRDCKRERGKKGGHNKLREQACTPYERTSDGSSYL
jgi:hypothetical protein